MSAETEGVAAAAASEAAELAEAAKAAKAKILGNFGGRTRGLRRTNRRRAR